MSKTAKKKTQQLLHHPINLSHCSQIVALVTVSYMGVIFLLAVGIFAGINFAINETKQTAPITESIKEAGNYVPEEYINTNNQEIQEINTYPVDIIDYDFSSVDQQLDQDVNINGFQQTIDQDLQEIDDLTYNTSSNAVLGESDYYVQEYPDSNSYEDYSKTDNYEGSYDNYNESPTYYYDDSYNDYWNEESQPVQEYQGDLQQPSDLQVYVQEPASSTYSFVNSVNQMASSQNIIYIAFFVLLLGVLVYVVNHLAEKQNEKK